MKQSVMNRLLSGYMVKWRNMLKEYKKTAVLAIILALSAFCANAQVKFSQIPSGGTVAPVTDQLLTVRNSNTDLLTTPGTLAALNAAPAGTLTGTSLATNVLSSSLTAVGTLTTGIWHATPLTTAYLPVGTSGATIPLLNTANTWSAIQTFGNSDIRLLGSSTGYNTFAAANAGATNYTTTVPAVTGTLITSADTGTVTNTMLAGSIALTKLATQAANTVLGALTATTPSALTLPSCSTTASALNYTSGTGFGCNTAVNAATLGGATMASPGVIGGTTSAAGNFTSVNVTGSSIPANGIYLPATGVVGVSSNSTEFLSYDTGAGAANHIHGTIITSAIQGTPTAAAGLIIDYASGGRIGVIGANGISFFTSAVNTLVGNYDNTGHWRLGETGIPTIGANACGSTTQGTVAAGSNDHDGQITVGTVGVTACVVTFALPYTTAPRACVLQPANTAAAATGTTGTYISGISTGAFSIAGTALAGASYYYHCM